MTSANAVGVNFQNLSVAKDGCDILQDINAQAPCGSATVLIGPNGAGKTSLLRCLLGEMRYTGRISFFDSSNNNIEKARLAYVPQQLMADPQLPLRVYEFLSLGGQERPLWLGCSGKSRKKSKELLSMVGAESLENRRMGNLSGGEMRRVLLAAALGRKPQLLVLDEAEAGVDYRGERLFWELLDHSRKHAGFTLLMVSHNLPLAAHYATNVICVKKTVLAQGSPQLTLTASLLLSLFGVPIHLYPEQCSNAGESCPQCGAYGNSPYQDESGWPGKTSLHVPPRAG